MKTLILQIHMILTNVILSSTLHSKNIDFRIACSPYFITFSIQMFTLIFAQILKDNEVYNRLQKDGKEKTAACGGDMQRMPAAPTVGPAPSFHDRTQEVLILVGTLTSLLHNVNLEQHEFQIRTDKRLDETQACWRSNALQRSVHLV